MRGVILIAATALVLAGCAEGGDMADGPAGLNDSSVDDGGASASTADGGNASSPAEDAVDASLPTFNISLAAEPAHAGEAANITMDLAMDGSGPQGNATVWEVSIYGVEDVNMTTPVATYNGTGLPMVVAHTFEAAGNVSIAGIARADGYNEANATFVLTVLEMAAEDAQAAIPDPISVSVTNTVSAALGIVCETTYADFDPIAEGWVYKVSGTTNSNWNAMWRAGEEDLENGGLYGEVPAGADNVGMCFMAAGGNGSFTITMWHPMHPDAPTE